METSIIVCSRNRPNEIERCVKGILSNSFQDFELIIIDQSDNDNTENIIRKYIEWDKRIRFFRMQTKGVSRGFNFGVRMSSGSIIVKTDDDCVPANDWLEKIAKTYHTHKGVGIVCGSVVDYTGLFAGQKGRDFIENGSFTGPLSKRFFVGDGANISFKREVYERLNGFDELLGPGAPALGKSGQVPTSEDQDFIYRGLKYGFKVLCIRNIIVTHYLLRVKDAESYLSVSREMHLGYGALYLKNFRCGDYISLVVLFFVWKDRMLKIIKFILSAGSLSIKRPRIIMILHICALSSYWILLGAIRSLKYAVHKKYCLFMSKRAL